MLWCYRDDQGWGPELCGVARSMGVDAKVFINPHDVTEGHAFVHLHHKPDTREKDKRVAQQLALNHRITMIPEYRSSMLYDDKAEQARQLARWMPRTWIMHSDGAAYRRIKLMSFPFMSKTAEGAGSNNVRLIKDEAQARSEVKAAFLGDGIKCKFGQRQKGYLLWQEFIPENEGDIRVIVVGRKLMLLRRGNRDDRPMASGSGKIQLVNDLDEQTHSALLLADQFFTAERMRWCGIDLVWSKTERRWVVLETTVGWTKRAYDECVFFERDGSCMATFRKTKYVGADMWRLLVDEIAAGTFKQREGW